MPYCIYLRKSRADDETEKHDGIETLARHEAILLELSKRHNLDIVEIYREVVSGETISSRPMAQKLLSDVENNLYDGVLVVDIDRLARGDSVDQGIIARAFKYSKTKIITPSKTYDPDNEFDEEYFEFGLFMARREYKIINRRMQRGRKISSQEGKFIGSLPPYGYDRVKLEGQRGYSLEKNVYQSENVKLIFNLFVNGDMQTDGSMKRLGSTLIAKKLNFIDTENKKWRATTIRDILKNPVYVGKIRNNVSPSVKRSDGGKVKITRLRNRSENWTIVDGLHEPIIKTDIWEKAQQIIKENNISPVKPGQTMKNPLAGLVFCKKCGKTMIRHVSKKTLEEIVCQTIGCKNSGIKLNVLENKILSTLKSWLENYKIKLKNGELQSNDKNKLDINQMTLKNLDNEISELTVQLENIHNLLEKGIYDVDKFLERSRTISNKINELKQKREDVLKIISLSKSRISSQRLLIPKMEKIIEAYGALSSVEGKNNLLKEVIEQIIYEREGGGRWVDAENFNIEVYPRIPK